MPCADDPFATQCDGDINGDGLTNVHDLLAVIDGFGQTYGVDDVLLVMGDFGCSP